MIRQLLFFSLLGITALSVASVRLSPAKSSFTSQATNQTNIFSTAAEFATAVPNEVVQPTPSPSPSPSPTPFVPQSGDVVINEIMWGGNSDEWIELKNMTANSIDLSNWKIENAASSGNPITIPASQSIAANGFYLIAKNKTASAINIDPDFEVGTVSLLDGGEVLTLKNSLAQTIDTANTPPGWSKGNNNNPRHSMERITPPGDGTMGTNWQDATTHTNMDGSAITDEFGTPKAPNGL